MLRSSPDECGLEAAGSLNGSSSRTSPDEGRVTTGRRHPRTQRDVLRMLETETFHKETLSPFNPLPAIGQSAGDWEDKFKERSLRSLNDAIFRLDRMKKSAKNYYVDDDSDKNVPALNEVNLRNYRMSVIQNEEKHTDLLKEIKENNKAKKLLRQQTYHVIDPVFVIDKDGLPQKSVSDSESICNKNDEKRYVDKNNNEQPLDKSNGLRKSFGNFENRKRLLDRREREIIPIAFDEVQLEKERMEMRQNKSETTIETNGHGKMNDLIEIFDSLQISRKYKEKVKKPNYWF